jgi:hypothetical protein
MGELYSTCTAPPRALSSAAFAPRVMSRHWLNARVCANFSMRWKTSRILARCALSPATAAAQSRNACFTHTRCMTTAARRDSARVSAAAARIFANASAIFPWSQRQSIFAISRFLRASSTAWRRHARSAARPAAAASPAAIFIAAAAAAPYSRTASYQELHAAAM